MSTILMPCFRKSTSAATTSEQDLFGSHWPLGYAGGDTNLYRYVGNNPLDATDPSGLAKEPLPNPGVETTGPTNANVEMAWYRRPYGFAPFLPTKPAIVKKYGEIRPDNCGAPLNGVLGKNHQFAGRPLADGAYFGVQGAGPCIGVIVVCPTQVAAFHFSATDDAGATLRKYAWPKDCTAVICGGDNSAVSNDEVMEVISCLERHGIKIQGMVNMDGCFYGSDGKWYVGSTNKPSADKQKK